MQFTLIPRQFGMCTSRARGALLFAASILAAIVSVAFSINPMSPPPQQPAIPQAVIAEVPQVLAAPAESPQSRVSAFLLVHLQPWEMYEPAKSVDFDLQQFEVFKATQAALLRSYYVINSALDREGVYDIVMPLAGEDPITWLEEHIQVEFVDQTGIMVVSLTEGDPAEMEQVLNAVLQQYIYQYVQSADREEGRRLKILRERAMCLQKEIDQHEQDVLDLQPTEGEEASGSVELAILQSELEAMWDSYADVRERILKLELQIQAPPQIELLAEAMTIDEPPPAP